MTRYLNIDGDSNVVAYSIGSTTYIDVQFGGGAVYRYSYASAGSYHVERMKELAEAGTGLNSYIMCNCRFKYEK